MRELLGSIATAGILYSVLCMMATLIIAIAKQAQSITEYALSS